MLLGSFRINLRICHIFCMDYTWDTWKQVSLQKEISFVVATFMDFRSYVTSRMSCYHQLQCHSCKSWQNQSTYCMKSVQIRTRNNSVFGQFSLGDLLGIYAARIKSHTQILKSLVISKSEKLDKPTARFYSVRGDPYSKCTVKAEGRGCNLGDGKRWGFENLDWRTWKFSYSTETEKKYWSDLRARNHKNKRTFVGFCAAM